MAASGSVLRGADGTYGTWNGQFCFQYQAACKRLSGGGTYAIVLDGPLAEVADLNLLKIASNYLKDVPLLTGGTGDTGDMQSAVVSGNGWTIAWNPPAQPAFFPSNQADGLCINVSGCRNVVDAAAQGHQRIAAASKPSLCVSLVSKQPGIPMIFGGVFDAAKAQKFWEDNVGITPLVLRGSPWTSYEFDVVVSSAAVAADGSVLH